MTDKDRYELKRVISIHVIGTTVKHVMLAFQLEGGWRCRSEGGAQKSGREGMRSGKNQGETAIVVGQREGVGVAHVVDAAGAVHPEGPRGIAHPLEAHDHTRRDVEDRQDRTVGGYLVGNHPPRAEACRCRGSSPDGSA